eukprot:gene16139-19204_t
MEPEVVNQEEVQQQVVEEQVVVAEPPVVEEQVQQAPPRRHETRVVKCKDHHDQNYAFYCETCDVAICGKCILDKHNGHRFVNLNANTLQGLLDTYYQSVQTARSFVENAQRKNILIHQASDNFQSTKAREIALVTGELQRLKDMVVAQEDLIIQTMNMQYQEIESCLNVAIDKNDRVIQDLSAFIRNSETYKDISIYNLLDHYQFDILHQRRLLDETKAIATISSAITDDHLIDERMFVHHVMCVTNEIRQLIIPKNTVFAQRAVTAHLEAENKSLREEIERLRAQIPPPPQA